ncbi:MAG: acyl-CoA dehydrogenase protein, partial [uncultured bacterium]
MRSYYSEPHCRYGELYASFAASFREIAFEIDSDPQAIFKYSDLSAVDFILSDRDSTAVKRTEYLEAFGYGDAGVLLACPGPSLSGLMLRELGLPDQVDAFYSQLKEKRMRTFFALTETEKGSDANQIQTRLIKTNNHFILNGAKSFFGNGAVSNMGVVLARMFDGPVGIRAVWLTPEIINDGSIKKQTLPQFSLCGAQIAVMQFNQTVIPESQV